MKKFVYPFEQGDKAMKSLLGGKGANLAEMTQIGLPVPPGFIISTEACQQYYIDGRKVNQIIEQQIYEQIKYLEVRTGKSFFSGSGLLLSVRSGAAVSMPGMMDTVLNLGLNDTTVEVLARNSGNQCFAYDCYRRFLQMYGNVVLRIPLNTFESGLKAIKAENSIHSDTELSEVHLKRIVENFKDIIYEHTEKPFEQDPGKQLMAAVHAVFNSWDNQRAKDYRRINKISDQIGTAVTIQLMVFGNMGNASGTGVVFSRNPSNGTREIFGEFLLNAQGEDIVAGARTPKLISALEKLFPEIYKKLSQTIYLLEEHYRDMQDIEFTIEKGKLYLLQTRAGKRTALAATNIAVDMVREGLLHKQDAIRDFDIDHVKNLLHPTFEKKSLLSARQIASGLPACPGAASGKVYFTTEDVLRAEKKGINALLVRSETSADDVQGMFLAKGILTAKGGITSHAAVVARGMGKCCITGCESLSINEDKMMAVINGIKIRQGDILSIDGTTGKVYKGELATEEAGIPESFNTLLGWADEVSELSVFANADSPVDARKSIAMGAAGIGLCRTEHMFFNPERIMAVREMIFSGSKGERVAALDKLFPFQKEDFSAIFKVMKEYPVYIRLLDPPLHEFLPGDIKEMKHVAKELGLSFQQVEEKINDLSEKNPMLGHRGCRLGITYPEIYRMQVKAIVLAALEVKKSSGIIPKPEIMIPLVGSERELSSLRRIVERIIAETDKNCELRKINIGTMIEVPRACMLADKIAAHADFFSFGTNDLTQLTYGYSRDDAEKFIRIYLQKNILQQDPFQVLDEEGVGEMIKMAIEKGKGANKNLKLGICGEHGGEPLSILFCQKTGLDYISCSPFRIPVAKIAAAKAALAATGLLQNVCITEKP